MPTESSVTSNCSIRYRRLRVDLARATVQQSGEKITIPDTQYDSDFWRDVDDEGVGGHNRS